MTIRVQNTALVNFGTVTATVTITHVGLQRGSETEIVKQLPAALTYAAQQELVIPAGDLDVVYPDGDLGDDHMDALVKSWWGATGTAAIKINLKTDATTNVATTGYSQQTVSAWTIATE